MSGFDLNKFKQEFESKLEEMEKRLDTVENKTLEEKLFSILNRISTVEGLDVFSSMLYLIKVNLEIQEELFEQVNNKMNEMRKKGVNKMMSLNDNLDKNLDKKKNCHDLKKDINSLLDKDELTEEECKRLCWLYQFYKEKDCDASSQVVSPLTPTHTLSSRKQPGADSKNNTIDKHKLRQKLEKCSCSDIV